MNTTTVNNKMTGKKMGAGIGAGPGIGSPGWLSSVLPQTLVAPKIGTKQNVAYKEVYAAFTKAFSTLEKHLPEGYNCLSLRDDVEAFGDRIQQIFILGYGKSNA